MTPEELSAELAAGRLRPAYLLAGEEPLLREDALRALREAVLAGAGDAFDFERIEAARVQAGALGDSLRILPVVAERRLVVLEEPDASRGGVGEALPGLLADHVAGEHVSCVLVTLAAKPDRRARWVRAFGDAVVECTAPRRTAETAAFVRREAERQGVALERGAAELLAERAGPQLLWLRQEIAKLALLAGDSRAVTRAHVAAGTQDASEAPIWDLTDAIGEGRAGDALTVLSRLLGAGAPPPVLLGSIVSHFRRLLRVAHGAEVSGPAFVQRKLAQQARRFGTARLRASLDAIHDTDLALKGEGALPAELALERLVLALSS
ncbi:MAG TPA: DNA polymerase III subunit delta [Myxococcota bacterium]|nr:DNA polymerase III subunit delta [Myxococcota bacterium]